MFDNSKIDGVFMGNKQQTITTDNEVISQECKASIDKLKALREKLKTLPVSTLLISCDQQNKDDDTNSNLQEVKKL